MRATAYRYKGLLAWFVLIATGSVATAEAESGLPPHLLAAKDLVHRLNLDDTDYKHQAFDVSWEAPAHCFADCSGFLDALLMHTYGLKRESFKKWVGSPRPNAAAYYEAIQAKRGFEVIASVSELRPGDILAVFYRHRTDNSGHILIADGAPEAMAAKKPLMEGLQQWLLPVIDCSESGHGPQDSRHKKGPDGKDHAGLGRGYLRLYAHPSGQIVGFTWSTLAVSAFKGSDEEPLIIGRYDSQFRP